LPRKSKDKSGNELKPDQKLTDFALKLLSYRPRSQSEITFRLKRKKASHEQIELIISRLKSLKLLDDTEFVTWWQTQRDRFKPRSFRILRLELIKKGVNKDIISQVLDTSFKKEIARIKKALMQKFKLQKLPQKQSKRQKALRFLQSRGFSWEHIKQATSS